MKNTPKKRRANAPTDHGAKNHENPSNETGYQAIWLDNTEIALMFHVDKRTLARYHKAGMIPASKLGGRVYYRPRDIDQYLTDHLVCKPIVP